MHLGVHIVLEQLLPQHRAIQEDPQCIDAKVAARQHDDCLPRPALEAVWMEHTALLDGVYVLAAQGLGQHLRSMRRSAGSAIWPGHV